MKITILLVIAVLSMAFATPAKVTLSGENMPKPNEEKFWHALTDCARCDTTVWYFGFFGLSGFKFAKILCKNSQGAFFLDTEKCDLLLQKYPEIIEQLDNNVSPKEICSAPDVGFCSA